MNLFYGVVISKIYHAFRIIIASVKNEYRDATEAGNFSLYIAVISSPICALSFFSRNTIRRQYVPRSGISLANYTA